MRKKQELSKNYNSKEYEEDIYKKWKEGGNFKPENLDLPKDAENYTIVLPPPNITDRLHLGHSSMLAIEDLMIRFHRMKGFRTLWIPGTDHAAIATQNVVEKKLLKEEGLTRHDLGREKFLEKVWEFLNETQATILKQTKRMGASLDWSRNAFTLDKQREKAVRKMFVDMYNAGVIYRGERIVNWCPRCHSTLADDEIEYKSQNAKLYTFKYDKDFPISISTTRPETKLGDTAVAVNPEDKRYKKYIGKTYKANLCGIGLDIKIIADKSIDMEFGTGALGVTPAHSMVDWQMAQTNDLPIKKVINEDGNIYPEFGEFGGKTANEARKAIVDYLKKNNLLEEEEEIENNLSVCYRCDTPIEPLPSKQWFISVDKKLDFLGGKSLKEKGLEVAKNNEIEFIPDRFYKKYTHWMENLHDWCISRQIWFGHRIPVWYKKENQGAIIKGQGEIYVSEKMPKEDGWVQDPDTLDTWFSSGMWTFSTLGWPDNYKNDEKTGDLAKFHPTQVLETGYEILTLWVSRMIMMSLFALREIPFEKVYLHGMVLDKEGKKMSKSKGNGIDPVEMIEKYGADAVRLSLLIGSTPGNDIRMSEEKIEGFRNFVNKLWNIARFVMQNDLNQESIKEQDCSLADKWILSKMHDLVEETSKDLENYRFSQAGERLREFTWGEFADWYLEVGKVEKNQTKNRIMYHILSDLLKLWHPFIPFVTEAIWQNLEPDSKRLIVQEWPKKDKYQVFKDQGKEFEIIKSAISVIRRGRSQYNLPPKQEIKVIIYSQNHRDLILENADIIKNLQTNIKSLNVEKQGEKITQAFYENIGNLEVYIPLKGIVDIDKEKERLKKELEKTNNFSKSLENKLSNKKFTQNAPQEIIEKEKEKYKQQQFKLKELKDQIKNLE
ncbi:MAG: valine--tRNA ligase [Candidatus Moraniibacteriota bacterium]